MPSSKMEILTAPRSGRPVDFDEERLNQLLHENSRQTTRELLEEKWCLYINMKQRRKWLSPGKLRTSIKSKKKEVSKMLILLNLTFHFNDLKINRN